MADKLNLDAADVVTDADGALFKITLTKEKNGAVRLKLERQDPQKAPQVALGPQNYANAYVEHTERAGGQDVQGKAFANTRVTNLFAISSPACELGKAPTGAIRKNQATGKQSLN